MNQPSPSTGQPAGPLPPAAPAPVRTAVKLMYTGAAITAAMLIAGLALIITDINAAARGQFLGHSLTSPQARPFVITVWTISGLGVIALWLWMARTNGQGRNWARIVSTVLFGLATLQLLRAVPGATPPLGHAGSGAAVLYYGMWVAAWLAGAAAVWLLWRPASRAFFTPHGTQAHVSSEKP
jgi:hypothetical protein